MFKIKRIEKDFYLQNDVFKVAENLLGKVLCTNIGGKITSGIIVEVECYNGITDKASHSYNNKRTDRTEIMYHEGGVAYVYLCYGIHNLFNVVIGPENDPKAILIRAIDPVNGVDIMMYRRNKKQIDYSLSSGPGSLTAALNITLNLNGEHLDTSKQLWIEDRGYYPLENVVKTKRIGVDYAGKDADLPYRFYLNENKWVSKK